MVHIYIYIYRITFRDTNKIFIFHIGLPDDNMIRELNNIYKSRIHFSSLGSKSIYNTMFIILLYQIIIYMIKILMD